MSRVAFDTFQNVIDGKLVSTTNTRHGINPARLEELPSVPVSSQDDVQAAVNAARRAATSWATVPLQERQQRVVQLADALVSQKEEFANMLTLEQGKPLSAAAGEVATAAGFLKGIAKLGLPDTIVVDNEEQRITTRYVPVGVCVGIVPWNFPITTISFKLGLALVAGNPIVLKPSPFTPYCGLKVVELAQQFFPPGVVQVLSGDDNLGPWLTAHPGVDKVSFTGSAQTGIKVMKSCAATLKRVTLELGGNDPAVVCADVDISTVAAKVATLALYNSGQVCVAIKRIYVHSSIYDEFLEAMLAAIKKMAVGDGLDSGSFLGPVQNKMQYEKIMNLFHSIQEDGLNVTTPHPEKTFSNKSGYYINPVVVTNPPDTSRIVQEEPFGPIFPVMKWDTEEEVIQRANDSRDGLGASVWTNSPTQADRIATQLQAGTVWINTHSQIQPDVAFGGHKQSGIGTELGIEGLKAYCNVQTIHQKKSGSKL
ncbi:hypothetical protein QQS21_010871 [Conoideocrella luteorostrata]|uniref:aldehyde dehydrogenase (NAD(+)) n=1 Tax=Conoideocrella luteorostrata TaxID=1105319 RepID=A0AAJ0FNY0_9HYPO|nr:hypothetical protein QQS21_010871 [Conoideocrella luteorostrata]